MPTFSELLAQQADIAAQLAEYEPQVMQEAQDVLTSEAALELVARLTAVRDKLRDGVTKTQIGNVLTVLSAGPEVLTHEISRAASRGDTSLMMESMARLKASSDAQKIEQQEVAIEMTPN